MPSLPFTIPSSPKPIHCILSHPPTPPTPNTNPPPPSLIFTHGAGGTLASAAIANFTTGFSHHLSLLCFQGTMHLPTRTKTFPTITHHQNLPPTTPLGGRSMGARAAIMAATPKTTHLILISYPLQTATATRDQILLHIHPSTHVLFVSGDRDPMCHLPRLESVRARMQCPTWRIVVEGADHGMDVRPRKFTEAVGVKVGEIVAAWIRGRDESRREGKIFCTGDGEVEWTGWTGVHDDDDDDDGETQESAATTKTPDKTPAAKPPTTTTTKNPSTSKRKTNTTPPPPAKKRKPTHAQHTRTDKNGGGIATRTRSAPKKTT
ncbi:MAG: hypothetical protein Q9182_001900 [Xanthomendoza sp. 2 TL-2023]